MTPTFSIMADGSDITAAFNDRLIELSIQDNAGMHNDKLSIEIDDRKITGSWIQLPPNGTVYDVSLGYKDAPNQDVPAPLTFMGRFIQDEVEVEFSKSGRTFRINAYAVTTGGTFKQPRTRSYHETTLGDIVQQCAQRNGLQAVIAPGFESIYIQHIDQTNESDASFLTRMYDRFGAIAKPANGKLYFGPEDGIPFLMGSGSSSPVINEWDTLGYRYLNQSQAKYKDVNAKYHDKDKAELQTVTAQGQDQNQGTLPQGNLNTTDTVEPPTGAGGN